MVKSEVVRAKASDDIDIFGDEIKESCDLEVSILAIDQQRQKRSRRLTVRAGLAQVSRFDEEKCAKLVIFDEDGKASVKGSKLLNLLLQRCKNTAIQTAHENENIRNTQMFNFLL